LNPSTETKRHEHAVAILHVVTERPAVAEAYAFIERVCGREGWVAGEELRTKPD